MKLNIGSGPHYCPGWVNLEKYQGQCEVRGDIFALPFGNAAFEQVYLGHVLEHLVWDEVPVALAEVARVLAPAGRVMVVGPCIERAVATDQPAWLLKQIIAEQSAALAGGGAHQWTSTELLTLVAMRQVFPTAKPVPVGEVYRPEWPNQVTAPWQLAVSVQT